MSCLGLKTITKGHNGIATVENYGKAVVGDHGTATAGNFGTAIAGNEGSAIAGDYGTATAGIDGIATAGVAGTLRIKYWDHKTKKVRWARGHIGENGLLPNIAYKTDDAGKFYRVH